MTITRFLPSQSTHDLKIILFFSPLERRLRPCSICSIMQRSTSFIKQNRRHGQGAIVRERMIFACFTGDGKRTRASSKETLGSHVTCIARCLHQAEKNKGFVVGSESEQQPWSQTSTQGTEWAVSPQNGCVELAHPPHMGSDPG